jgi:group II intron reverse transcriptase/maturase
MHERGKSDSRVVPTKSANEIGGAPLVEEQMEGRRLANRNSPQRNSARAQHRSALQQALARVRQAASKEKECKLTTLWHHVYAIERLEQAYFDLKRKSAPGVDGETWQHYGKNLGVNLADLSRRLQSGAYQAKPVQRAYIKKLDGRERPLGMPTLEDKLVQRAAAEVMGAVYETCFKGFSYGFRPGRSPHNALDALTVAIERKKVGWILDADIRGFFDTIDHEWLLKFVEHRIADERVLRHVKKWLNAGVLEDGVCTYAEAGTPQGGSISPLLANIYLHYVLDLWVEVWREKYACGEVIIVRYADDFVVGFQYRDDAERFQRELRERLLKFKLELHPDKTRLIEFGRFAADNRRERDEGHPESFHFLGFTHSCGRTRTGGFRVVRQTMRKKLGAKLQALKLELKRRMHHMIVDVGAWLRAVALGHYNYYAVPGNGPALWRFRTELTRLWRHALRRRSEKSRMSWKRMAGIADRWLPQPRIIHPYPSQRLCVTTGGKSPVR